MNKTKIAQPPSAREGRPLSVQLQEARAALTQALLDGASDADCDRLKSEIARLETKAKRVALREEGEERRQKEQRKQDRASRRERLLASSKASSDVVRSEAAVADKLAVELGESVSRMFTALTAACRDAGDAFSISFPDVGTWPLADAIVNNLVKAKIPGIRGSASPDLPTISDVARATAQRLDGEIRASLRKEPVAP